MSDTPKKEQQPIVLPVIILILAVAAMGWFLSSLVGQEDEAKLATQLAATPTDSVANSPKLLRFALKRGHEVYEANCASCHGADMTGNAELHTPDMTDSFWLYGGKDIETFKIAPSDIEYTVRYGIHDLDVKETRNLADMPPFGEAGRAGLPPEELEDLEVKEGRPRLTNDELEDLTNFVLEVSRQPADEAAAGRGKELYFGKAGCWDCHTYDYNGDGSIGSANLTHPETWLYGSSHDKVFETIAMGRNGVSPAFEGRLSDADIKAVALYVLGGKTKSTLQTKLTGG
ncbi:MAG TPA: c-type cytochrome [Alphaproteobacteria bacterium]|nr:c-type cytochrome [Alphaproteobacteria bacterium]